MEALWVGISDSVLCVLFHFPQFIFGVDAAHQRHSLVPPPYRLHVESGSNEALAVVPVLTLFVALWLLAFYFMRAGKLVNYISAPVMGGFITGICTTIILMQLPKLMGGTAGTGEFLELAEHIAKEAASINLPSVALGVSALVILLLSKKFMPKFPMVVVLMAAGAVMTRVLPVREWGDPDACGGRNRGFLRGVWRIYRDSHKAKPSRSVCRLRWSSWLRHCLRKTTSRRKMDTTSTTIRKYWRFLPETVAAFYGLLSDQRLGIPHRDGRTVSGQDVATGIVAGGSMIVLLLCGTGFIGYLPVPVLTAIVISALLGATEFELAVRRKKWYTECSDLCGRVFRCAVSWNDQRRTDRDHPLLYRDDHPYRKAGEMFSRHSAGTPPFPRFERRKPDPCHRGRFDLSFQQQSVFREYPGT